MYTGDKYSTVLLPYHNIVDTKSCESPAAIIIYHRQNASPCGKSYSQSMYDQRL